MEKEEDKKPILILKNAHSGEVILIFSIKN